MLRELTDEDLPLNRPETTERLGEMVRSRKWNDQFTYLYDYAKSDYLAIGPGVQKLLHRRPHYFRQVARNRQQMQELVPADQALFRKHFLPTYRRSAREYPILGRQVSYTCRILTGRGTPIAVNIFSQIIELDRHDSPLCDFGCVRRLTEPFEECQFGFQVLNSSIVHHITKSMFPVHTSSQISSLSERELEILDFLSQGMSSREIAEQLFISPHTVDTHRRNMIRKVGVRSTIELVSIYRES